MKKIDSISIVLISFFFFTIVLFTYLTKINEDITKYFIYEDSIHELKIINKEFDNFLLQQAIFINFDKINKSISKLDKTIEFLNSKESHKLLPSTYNILLQDVIYNYKLKLDSIEYFKSQNS